MSWGQGRKGGGEGKGCVDQGGHDGSKGVEREDRWELTELESRSNEGCIYCVTSYFINLVRGGS